MFFHTINTWLGMCVWVCLKVLLLPGPVLIADNIWCTSLFTFVFVLVCTDVCVCVLLFLYSFGIVVDLYQRCCGSRCSFISVIGLFWTQPPTPITMRSNCRHKDRVASHIHTHKQTHSNDMLCTSLSKHIIISLVL